MSQNEIDFKLEDLLNQLKEMENEFNELTFVNKMRLSTSKEYSNLNIEFEIQQSRQRCLSVIELNLEKSWHFENLLHYF